MLRAAVVIVLVAVAEGQLPKCLDRRPKDTHTGKARTWVHFGPTAVVRCRDYTRHPNRCKDLGGLASISGVKATSACCACGGGVRIGAPPKVKCGPGTQPAPPPPPDDGGASSGHRRAQANGHRCIPCTAFGENKYSASGSPCTACRPGKQPNAARTKCTKCHGMLVSVKGAKCVKCPPGALRDRKHTGCRKMGPAGWIPVPVGPLPPRPPSPPQAPPPPPPPPPPPHHKKTANEIRNGDDCKDPHDNNPCCKKPCKNKGRCLKCKQHWCIAARKQYTCTCPLGFKGDHCESNINDCQSKPCKNGGKCVDSVRAFHCTCRAGFEGTLCNDFEKAKPPPPPPPPPPKPKKPVCENTYDDAYNSCTSLLKAGFSCKDTFCSTCEYAHMCDKICSLCPKAGQKVKPPPPPSPPPENKAGFKLACPDRYDQSNGAGSCQKLIALGYSCKTDFCAKCQQAKYCDGSCNSCPPPPPPSFDLSKLGGGKANDGPPSSCKPVSSKYSPLNPKASVYGLKWVKDCKGACVFASWYADGKCDDSPVLGGGNFYCKTAHFDGGDCLTHDGCTKTGKCSLCGSRWKALMEVCPAASSNSAVPDKCTKGCGDMWTQWWKGCKDENHVKQLDVQLGRELTKFTSKCEKASGKRPPPPPRGRGGRGGGGH